MTDKQLATLLHQFQCRLTSELAAVEKALPDELKIERQVRTFIPANGVNVIVEYPILNNLYVLANDLQASVDNLANSNG